MSSKRTIRDQTWQGLYLLGVLLIVASLGACNNPFGLFQKQLDARDQADPYGADGLGAIILSFNQTDGQARSIAAASVAPSELAYSITLTRAGFTTIELVDLPYDAGGVVIPDVEPGDWQLMVEGFLVSPPAIDPAYRGSQTVSVVAGSNPVNLTLNRLQEGTGGLQLSISWPVAAILPVDNYEILWTTSLTDFENGTGGTPPFSASFSDTGGTFSVDESVILSGYYYMTIIWKKGSLVVGRTPEAVHIHDTLVAAKTINLPAGSFSNPPPAPLNLQLDYIRDVGFNLTDIHIAWDDVSYTETGYKVYRSINGSVPDLLAGSLLPNSVEYTDSDVTGFVLGDSVVYNIAAANSFGEGRSDTAASTLRSMSFGMGSATAGALPPNSLVFSGEQFNLPKRGNLVGPQLLAPDEVLTQRFTGWHDGVVFFYEEDFFTMPDQNVVFTTQWTDDTPVIGKVGPAGGYVFYRNPNPTWAADDGWLYFEIAPQDQEALWISGGATQTTANGFTMPDLGWGKLNTMAIMAQDGHAASAAAQSAGLMAGGFNDWFLPSEYELAAIYNNLWLPLFLGSFVSSSTNPYWASNEADALNSRGVTFNDGGSGSFGKSSSWPFRPIRAFRTVNPTWLVRYHSNQADSGDAPSSLLHYEAGDTVNVADTGSLGRTGYIFQAWNTQADGGGTSYTAGSDSFPMPGNNLTLYATWRLPDIPAPPSNLDAALSATGVLLSWTDNGGTETGYRVYKDGTPLPDVIGPDTTSFEDTSITGGVSYDYYITAYTDDGESGPSTPVTITYLEAFVGTGDPANASVDLNLTLDFYYPVVTGATTYHLYLSTIENEVINWTSSTAEQSGPSASFANVGPLSPSTQYYWRMVASDGLLAERVSPVSSFTTGIQPLAVSSLMANLDAGGIQLDWTHTSSGQIGYHIYRDAALLTSVGPSILSYLDTTATFGTTYTYEVRPFNGVGETTGPTDVHTRIDLPALVYPANAEAAIRLRPTLNWNTVAGAVSYDVYLSTEELEVSSLDPLARVADALAALSYSVVTDLTPSQTYYWRVIARNPQGSVTYSPIFNFSARSQLQYVGPTGNDTAEGSMWTAPLQTISEALDRAVDGDMIYVMEGTYLESLVVDKDITLIGSHDVTFMPTSVDTNPTIIRNPTSGADNASLTVVAGGVLNLQDVLVENGLPGGNFVVDAMRVLDGASVTLSSVRLRSGKDVSGSSYAGATSSGLSASGSGVVNITGDTKFIMGTVIDPPALVKGLHTTDTFSGTITLTGVDNDFEPVQAPTAAVARNYQSVHLLGDPVLQSTVSISGANFELGQTSTALGSNIITITAPQMDVVLEENTIREAINGNAINVGVYAQASRSLLIQGNTFPWDDIGLRDDTHRHIVIHIETANHQNPPKILGNRIALGPNISTNYTAGIQVDATQAIIANNVIYRTSTGLATDSVDNTHNAIKLGWATGAPSSTIVGNTMIVSRDVAAYQNFFIAYAATSTGHGILANNILIAETAPAKIDYQNYAPSDSTVTVYNNAFGPNTAIQMPSIATDPITTLNGYAWADANYYIDVHGLDTRDFWFSTLAGSHVDIRTGGSNTYLGDPDLNKDINAATRSDPVTIGAYEVD